MEMNGHFDEKNYCRRLRVLRRYLDMSQTELARMLEIPMKKWNHYERGYPLSRETVFKLYVKVPAITPWWLWFGDARGMDSMTIEHLQKLEREEAKRERAHALAPTKPLPMSEVRKRISSKG
jgi:DNA-binding XRE family transcriptional regulator